MPADVALLRGAVQLGTSHVWNISIDRLSTNLFTRFVFTALCSLAFFMLLHANNRKSCVLFQSVLCVYSFPQL